MKKLLIIALLLLTFALVSCDGETPSESVSEVSTHVCDFSGWVEHDENGHFVTCECGEVSRGEHVVKELNTIVDPTCGMEGKKVYKCKDCLYRLTVVIPRKPHKLQKIEEVPATCLEDGVSAYEHCEECNNDFGKTILQKLGHDYKGETCKTCGYKKPDSCLSFKETEYGWIVVRNDGYIYLHDTELVIPSVTDQGEKVVGVGDLGFRGLKKVTIPDGIEYILPYAFSGCTELEEVVFLTEPTTSIVIKDYAFAGCKNLKNLTLPEKCVLDGVGIFMDNESMKEIVIPNGTEDLGNALFMNCTSLEKVLLPDSITGPCGARLFYNCTSLKEVYLGSVYDISDEMFMGCISLEEVTFPISIYRSGHRAFSGCVNLKKVVFENGVEDLDGEMIFADCTSLESITLPKELPLIAYLAFSGCTSLKEIRYEGTVEEWKKYCVSDNFLIIPYYMNLRDIVCTDGIIKVKDFIGAE